MTWLIAATNKLKQYGILSSCVTASREKAKSALPNRTFFRFPTGMVSTGRERQKLYLVRPVLSLAIKALTSLPHESESDFIKG